MSFLKELFAFLRKRKKLWLMPIVVMMLVFGILLIFGAHTVMAPFIYTLF